MFTLVPMNVSKDARRVTHGRFKSGDKAELHVIIITTKQLHDAD